MMGEIPTTLLVNLASLAVHVDEHAQPHSHDFDLLAARAEVLTWLNNFGPLAPVRRAPRTPDQEPKP